MKRYLPAVIYLAITLKWRSGWHSLLIHDLTGRDAVVVGLASLVARLAPDTFP